MRVVLRVIALHLGINMMERYSLNPRIELLKLHDCDLSSRTSNIYQLANLEIQFTSLINLYSTITDNNFHYH